MRGVCNATALRPVVMAPDPCWRRPGCIWRLPTGTASAPWMVGKTPKSEAANRIARFSACATTAAGQAMMDACASGRHDEHDRHTM